MARALPAPPASERDALLPKLDDIDPEAQAGSPDEDDLDKPKIPGVKIQYILPALGLGIFLAAMDNTIVVSSYGAIGNDLHELNRTSWIATAYLLTTTSFQPLYGKLSDIFGRKASLLFAYTVFGLGCLGCGLSTSLEQLVAARAFAGIGGGGMTTVVSILVSDIVGLRSRGTWQGVLNIVFASGAAAGAPLGGLMADTIGWRWSFIFQFPATLLAILIVSVFLHLPPTEQSPTTFKTRFYRVDFLGAFVLVAAVLSLLIGLDQAGNLSLTSPLVIISLSIALVLFLAFIYVESLVAAEPFAPPHIVKEPTILACCLANFFSFGSYMAVLFYVPLYYQAVEALSARQAGMRLLPAIAGSVAGSLGGGIVMQKTGKFYWLTVWAYTLPVLGSVLVVYFSTVTSHVGVSMGILLSGFGNSIGVTTSLVALIAAAGSKDQAVATAVSYLFRALGTVAGVSIGSTLVQGQLRRELARRLTGDDADEIVRKVRESLEFIGTLPKETRDVVRACYKDSVQVAFLFAIGLSVCALVSAAFIKERRLGR
ncbi:major facilitator superfamily domain-containing protein [Tricharina praecox]|uniref:major facilitator superfamily domain-containing protein n=1 Tax=Tricharina praecox TaxID=43433 RepID=UPI0022205F23|nr:major facilitator superfamily domain-containing protein [Tricharina praecox]KAI5858775.1 major facilitator superfamily domain-containing protein [Tricharina praecox]